MIDRGAKLLYVFSGGSSKSYNYVEQFEDSMPFLKRAGSRFSVILNINVDHTYALYRDRLWLYEQVLEFMGEI